MTTHKQSAPDTMPTREWLEKAISALEVDIKNTTDARLCRSLTSTLREYREQLADMDNSAENNKLTLAEAKEIMRIWDKTPQDFILEIGKWKISGSKLIQASALIAASEQRCCEHCSLKPVKIHDVGEFYKD